MRITISGLLFLTSLVSGCATQVVPATATVNTVDVYMKHPSSDATYRLLSNSGDGVLDAKPVPPDGIIRFAIDNAQSDPQKCFYVSDGEKPIPINDYSYAFRNPLFSRFREMNEELKNHYDHMKKAEGVLQISPSYRDGQCISLTSQDIPPKPANACEPGTETSYGGSVCANYSAETPVETRVGNNVLCAIGGLVVSFINPFIGAAGGAACATMLDDNEKGRQKSACIDRAQAQCTAAYQSWRSVADNISNNPQMIQEQCNESKRKYYEATTAIDDLNRQVQQLAKSQIQISPQDYCATASRT
jgi:hypothetical protein